MGDFGSKLAERRRTNAKAFAALGNSETLDQGNHSRRVVCAGNGTTIFTVGYEKRSGADLISELLDLGVDTLVDIREKPTSRKPDFRKRALEDFCQDGGLWYRGLPELGSTEKQRKALRESGDMRSFRKSFLAYARRNLATPLDELATLVSNHTVALLCYERLHEDCHRSIVADLVATQLDGTVVAID